MTIPKKIGQVTPVPILIGELKWKNLVDQFVGITVND